MTEPDLVTAMDILDEYGQETLDRMEDFGWHHTDERGQPFWSINVAADILGLIALTEREEATRAAEGPRCPTDCHGTVLEDTSEGDSDA
jgi:hypothetical protein